MTYWSSLSTLNGILLMSRPSWNVCGSMAFPPSSRSMPLIRSPWSFWALSYPQKESRWTHARSKLSTLGWLPTQCVTCNASWGFQFLLIFPEFFKTNRASHPFPLQKCPIPLVPRDPAYIQSAETCIYYSVHIDSPQRHTSLHRRSWCFQCSDLGGLCPAIWSQTNVTHMHLLLKEVHPCRIKLQNTWQGTSGDKKHICKMVALPGSSLSSDPGVHWP